MIVYLFSTLLSCLFAFMAANIKVRIKSYNVQGRLKSKTSNKYNICFAVLSMMPLFLTAAFRSGIGVDYALYARIFRYTVISKNYDYYNTEWLYMAINRFIARFTTEEIYIFVVTSLFIYGFIFLAIYEQSECPWFSILLFVISTSYFISLNIVRQAMAIAIFLYSIKYIRKRQLLKYILCIWIASGLHSASIILFPLYFCNRVNMKPVKACIVLCIAICMLPVFVKLFYVVAIHTKFAVYYSSEKWGHASLQLIQLLIHGSILLFYMIFYKINKNDKAYVIYYNLQIISFMVCILSGFVPIVYRIINTFTFIPMISIPKMIKQIKSQKVRFFVMMIIIMCFTGFTILDIVHKGNQGVLPYTTIFSQQN